MYSCSENIICSMFKQNTTYLTYHFALVMRFRLEPAAELSNKWQLFVKSLHCITATFCTKKSKSHEQHVDSKTQKSFHCFNKPKQMRT